MIGSIQDGLQEPQHRLSCHCGINLAANRSVHLRMTFKTSIHRGVCLTDVENFTPW